MRKENATKEFLLRKGDPVGEFLGRLWLRPLVDKLWPTPEEKRRMFETVQGTDPLRRLGISTDPPETWKSLLLWLILVVGMGLALYVAAHLR